MKSNAILSAQQLSQEYYNQLLAGDRLATRNLIEAALHQGIAPRDLLTDLVWPIMELLQNMYRDDRITITQLNLGTRLNRSITGAGTPAGRNIPHHADRTKSGNPCSVIVGTLGRMAERFDPVKAIA